MIDRLATTNKQRPDNARIDDSVRDAIERVTIGNGQIEIRLSEAVVSDEQDRIVTIPWTPPSPYRRREASGLLAQLCSVCPPSISQDKNRAAPREQAAYEAAIAEHKRLCDRLRVNCGLVAAEQSRTTPRTW